MVRREARKRLNLLSALRLKIGLVQQEPVLFAASIFENIALLEGWLQKAEQYLYCEE